MTKEKYSMLHSGEIYDPNIEGMMDEQRVHKEKLYEFNFSRPSEKDKRNKLLNGIFADVGEGCYIEPPLNSNWGGKHVHLGKRVYANSNLTLVDDTHIHIGNHVMMGPNVVIIAGNHPISPKLRKDGLQYNEPVKIGNNVWIGSAVQILPGVEIGDNSIIGSGSVVTKNIPPNVVAVGSPCRVIKEITEE